MHRKVHVVKRNKYMKRGGHSPKPAVDVIMSGYVVMLIGVKGFVSFCSSPAWHRGGACIEDLSRGVDIGNATSQNWMKYNTRCISSTY